MVQTGSAREVETLIYTYAERIDAGDLAGVAELFRHGRVQPGPDVVFEGADRVRSMYEHATRIHDDRTPRTRHVVSNVIMEVDEEAGRATARSYYTVYQQTEDLPLQAIIVGRYRDSFHRLSGRWWFDTREIFVDLVGDLSHHLLFDL